VAPKITSFGKGGSKNLLPFGKRWRQKFATFWEKVAPKITSFGKGGSKNLLPFGKRFITCENKVRAENFPSFPKR